jgi:hypothetical protein
VFCPRRGLNRQEAAIYVGVSSSLSTTLSNRERCQNHCVSTEGRYGRERRGSTELSKDRAATNLRILPSLREVAKLTSQHIRDWHTGLGAAPKLTRSGRLVKPRKETAIDAKDTDAVRARRAPANRTLTTLKASLNHIYYEGRAANDKVWRKVKLFREADAPIVHFLRLAEPLLIMAALFAAPIIAKEI